MQAAKSINNIQIRLTGERWFHIVENHTELAGRIFDVLETIAKPDFIVKGWEDELLACKKKDKYYLVVVYKEDVDKKDGFIITAFITLRIHQIKRRKIIWQLKKS